MNLYDELGVPRNADSATIRREYKRRAQKAHPDRDRRPGATDRFKQLQLAYDVLIDPARRARYDASGQTERFNIAKTASDELAGLILRIVDALPDVDTIDIKARANEAVDAHIGNLKSELQKWRDIARRRAAAAKRMRYLGAEMDVLTAALREDSPKLHIADIEEKLAVAQAIKELLAKYDYAVESGQLFPPVLSFTFSTHA